MSASLVLAVDGSGDVAALMSDGFPWQELGQLEVTRASSIEFNQASQLWQVTITGEALPRGLFRDRGQAVAWEVEYFTKQIMAK